MSDTKINPKELPHEFLLKRHNLSIDQLSSHSQQLKKDLDKTLHLIVNRSKDGNVNLTPATQQKISTYDRYICDGIFEYLEEADKITEQQVEKEEAQLEDKREEVEQKMEEAHEEALEEKADEMVKNNEEKTTEEKPDEKKEESMWDFFDF
tara:strand:- start:41 stop:493 length:453 start_codon:yes stop_codon:yes gene_type:complete